MTTRSRSTTAGKQAPAHSGSAAAPQPAGLPSRLTLYVAGGSASSRRAQANLSAALAELAITLPVRTVDVLVEPEEALAQRIFATPALLLQVGTAREMLIGDLSQHDTVVATLAALRGEPMDAATDAGKASP